MPVPIDDPSARGLIDRLRAGPACWYSPARQGSADAGSSRSPRSGSARRRPLGAGRSGSGTKWKRDEVGAGRSGSGTKWKRDEVEAGRSGSGTKWKRGWPQFHSIVSIVSMVQCSGKPSVISR